MLPADGAAADPGLPALFAYDGSPSADRAIAAAATLLRPRRAVVATAWQSAATVVAVAMLAIPDDVASKGAAELDEGARLRAAGEASEGAAALAAAGWDCGHVALPTPRSVAATIIGAADERDAAIVGPARAGA